MKAAMFTTNSSHKSLIQQTCLIAADNSIICAFAANIHEAQKFFAPRKFLIIRVSVHSRVSDICRKSALSAP